MRGLKVLPVAVMVLAAQAAWAYAGRVVGSDSAAVEFATVVLRDATGGAVEYAVTDAEGVFSLRGGCADGMTLEVSAIGYGHAEAVWPFPDVIVLQVDNELGEVVVTGERPTVRVKGGALVAGISGSYLSKLPTFDAMIKQLPLIDMTGGGIEVIGKGTPLIYINGRQASSDELHTLQPSQIKNVEIVTAPGARYGAEVTSVLRITTLPRRGDGLSGFVQTIPTCQNRPRVMNRAYLMYRTGKFDIEVSGSAQNGRADDKTLSRTAVATDAVDAFIQNRSDGAVTKNEGFVMPRVTYVPNNRHSVGVMYTYSWNRNKFGADQSLWFSDAYSQTESLDYLRYSGPADFHKVNVFYTGKLGAGWNVEATADYAHGNDVSDTHSHAIDGDNPTVDTHNASRYNLWSGKLTGTYAWGDNSLFFGGEYANTDRHQLYTINDAAPGIGDVLSQNKQNRAAAFAGYERSLGKWGFELGLRYEFLRMKYYDFGVRLPEPSKRYSQLFPNATVSYSDRATGLNLSLSYERKVTHPTYSQLSAEVKYSSPYLYEGGNPDLRSQVANSLTFMLSWRDWSLMSSTDFYDDAIMDVVTLFDDRAIVLSRPENVKDFTSGTLTISYRPRIKCWNPTVSATLRYQHLDIGALNYNHPRFSGKFLNTFVLPRGWMLDASYEMATGGYKQLQSSRPVWRMGCSVFKSLFNDSLTLFLSFSDIFNTMKRKTTERLGAVTVYSQSLTCGRTVALNITYTFNSARSRYKGRSSTTEGSRLQSR